MKNVNIMIVNKNKVLKITSNNTGNFRYQRSSLKVHLSCIPNLTDTSNDSLEQSDVNSNIGSSYDIPLKSVSIVLERININNTALTRNYESLKNTTVAKPKQPKFNKQGELCNRMDIIANVNHLNKIANDNIKGVVTRNELSSAVSDISENEDSFMTAPIGCSTMIGDEVLDGKDKTYFQIADSLTGCSKNIQGKFKSNDKLELSMNHILKDTTKKVSKDNYELDPLTHIHPHMNVSHICQTLYKNSKLKCNNKDVEDITDRNSINTTQTSINVNTSIDVINERTNSCNKGKWKTFENRPQDINSVVTDTSQESINSICTSLEMNTSLDTSNKLQKSDNIVNFSTVRNINIIDKQRNIFNIENLNAQKANNYKVKHENEEILQKINNTEVLYIKTRSSVKESVDKNETGENENGKYSVTFADRRKCKRKLLPLHECSELLSLSPVQKECTPPHCLIFRKRHNNKKQNGNKRINVSNIDHFKMRINKDYEKKKQKIPKKIISKTIVIKKVVDEDILQKLKENKENVNKLETTDICALKRNSLNDFQPLKKLSATKKKQIQKLNIVITGLSNEDKAVVKNVVKVLGFAKIESKVTKSTTHVVTTGVRTINLLHGIVRGCWLISLEWVLKSLENNAWLSPEKYEMVHFSKAVLENRKDRQLFGKSYVPELFTTCGYIYVAKNTMPPCNLLKDLVKVAGGCITENSETAKIMIGEGGLKETWILDCITSGELQPYNQYKWS